MKIQTLYRGDSIPANIRQASGRQRGQTFARHFCGNGLLAKFSDGGSSSLLKGKNLLDLVLSHVGYEVGSSEQELADHSPLISFSEDKESAFAFSNRKKLGLQPCEFYEATHFIWQFDVSIGAELGPGRYQFKYQADSSNCRKTVVEAVSRGYESTSKGGPMSHVAIPLMDAIAGVYADADNRWHYAEIIDVVKFVNGHKPSGRDGDLIQRTLDRAGGDKEWLVYPMDPMPDGIGYSARFSMNAGLGICQCFKAAPRLKR